MMNPVSPKKGLIMDFIVTAIKVTVFCIGAFFTVVLLGDRREEVLRAVRRKPRR